MKSLAGTSFGLALLLATSTAVLAQDTSLNRSEVAAIKSKLVTVQTAMGADPAGYLKKDENFSLPTDFNPARDGKFWPITSGVNLRYTDRASAEGTASMEKMQQEFQAKYAAAAAANDFEAIAKMSEEIMKLQTAAVAAAMSPATRKEDMTVDVQLNMNPSVGIDPDAIVLERPGVIALRRKNDISGEKGDVTVYVDPVALRQTEELSKVELRTADGGVANRSGVFHVVITLRGTLADIESWVTSFDYPAILAVIDPRS
jgi:hypothetical protein